MLLKQQKQQMMLRRSEMRSVSLVSAPERCEADPMVTKVKLGLEQDLHLSREDQLCLSGRASKGQREEG